MARKPSRDELLASLAHWEEQATRMHWMLKAAATYPPNTWVCIRRPRLGFLLVRTDDYGSYSYAVDPEDTPRMRDLYRNLSEAGAHAEYDALRSASLEAASMARKAAS